MVRFPGRSATFKVLSISFLAFLLRISTFTLELLSIFIYDLFLDFFSALTFDLIVSTKFSNWFAISDLIMARQKGFNFFLLTVDSQLLNLCLAFGYIRLLLLLICLLAYYIYIFFLMKLPIIFVCVFFLVFDL